MLSCADYYLIMDNAEVGPETAKYIAILRACGGVEDIDGGLKLQCASELDQRIMVQNIMSAWATDFPTPDEDDE